MLWTNGGQHHAAQNASVPQRCRQHKRGPAMKNDNDRKLREAVIAGHLVSFWDSGYYRTGEAWAYGIGPDNSRLLAVYLLDLGHFGEAEIAQPWRVVNLAESPAIVGTAFRASRRRIPPPSVESALRTVLATVDTSAGSSSSDHQRDG
jgi:hypothetical protein